METLPGGLQAYVVGRGSRAVVVASDIFGMHTGRHKAICDLLSSEGYLVVMPDFFQGAFPDEGASLPWWKNLFQAPGVVTPLTTTWRSVGDGLESSVLPYLQQRGCTAPAGILGFCWGAWVVIHACAAFEESFACGVSAHPSFDKMALRWGEDEEAILRQVKVPQLVLASMNEPQSWKPGGSAQRALCSAGDPGHIFKEFTSMRHGFVPRGDLGDPQVASEVARAMEYITGFFAKHLRPSTA